MIDIYLKAATREELIENLPFARANQSDGYILDIIGTIYNNDAVYELENNRVVTPPTAKDGFHANLRIIDESLLSQIPASIQIAKPNLPNRRFL